MNELQNVGAQFNRALVDAERQRGKRTAEKENSARPATQYFHQQTTGTGFIRATAPITFDITFLEEPCYSYGAAAAAVPNSADFQDPFAFATLRSWVRDARGFYLGCYMSYNVSVNFADGTLGATPKVTMVHHLSFYGMAYKAMNSQMLTEVQNIAARPAGTGIV
jgi:hypothetical protein